MPYTGNTHRERTSIPAALVAQTGAGDIKEQLFLAFSTGNAHTHLLAGLLPAHVSRLSTPPFKLTSLSQTVVKCRMFVFTVMFSLMLSTIP